MPAKAAMPPITPPAMAPIGVPFPDEVTELVGVEEAACVVKVEEVGIVEKVLLLEVGVTDGVIAVVIVQGPIKTVAFFLSPLTRPGRRASSGHSPMEHGFCAQHPIKGGSESAHVYQSASGSFPPHDCGGILSYASSSKVVGVTHSSGQSPVAEPSRSRLQQPRNPDALSAMA